MKTIQQIAKRFKGRFTFQPVIRLGSAGFCILDTHKNKTCIVVGDREADVLKEIEHECMTIVINGNN